MAPVSEFCSDIALHYVRLVQARGVGSKTGRDLIAACGSIERLWSASDHSLQNIDGVGPKLISALKETSAEAATAIVSACEQDSIQLLCLEDKTYPELLKACDDAPLLLFAKGDVSTLNHPRLLSVVGARKASRESRLIARRWSSYCSKQGVAIVSGMAYGVDSAAHGGHWKAILRLLLCLVVVWACFQKHNKARLQQLLNRGV